MRLINGKSCDFEHPEAISQCISYMDTGRCNDPDNCQLVHPHLCRQYMHGQRPCSRSPDCKFLHPRNAIQWKHNPRAPRPPKSSPKKWQAQKKAAAVVAPLSYPSSRFKKEMVKVGVPRFPHEIMNAADVLIRYAMNGTMPCEWVVLELAPK
jgi:hypothetical protein